MTKVINLIGGPGVGKSTTALALMYLMKIKGLSVDYIPEVAKRIVWRGDFHQLLDQKSLIDETFCLLNELDTNVDYIITDGPLVLGLYYNKHYQKDNYQKNLDHYIIQHHNMFDNINFFLNRSENINYETNGRFQKEEEAKEIDKIMKETLINHNIPFINVKTEKLTENLTHSFIQDILSAL